MTDIATLVPVPLHDLLDRPLIAALTTVDGQSRPQSTAVWYLQEDGVIRCSITRDRQKWRNLDRNANCSLLIIDPDNPMRTVELRAIAEMEPDPDYEVVSRLATKYGADPERFRAMGGERYTVTFQPRRVVAPDRS